jgi:hypothetical protein
MYELIVKLALGEEIDREEITNALYEICDREHASCNDMCPVFRLNGSQVPDTTNDFDVNCGCDCFKNGTAMLKFIIDAKKGKGCYPKLSHMTGELISEGLKTCGLNEDLDAYYYIEEKLYPSEASEVRAFFGWLLITRRPYGSNNRQQRWDEFHGADWAELPEYWQHISPDVVMTSKEQYEKAIQNNG